MFEHILVPTDLTERSMVALEVAIKMAVHDASKVTLLHVIETIVDTECEDFDDFYKKLGKRAGKKMDKMILLHQNNNVAVRKEITYGKRVTEILKYAHEHAIDLIVLSSHKIDSADATQGWGTISYKVGILSQCPVLLVK